MWRNDFVDVEMHHFVRVMLKDSIKCKSVILENTVKLFLLLNGQVCKIAGNCTDVGRTIIHGQDSRFRSLRDCECIFRGGQGSVWVFAEIENDGCSGCMTGSSCVGSFLEDNNMVCCMAGNGDCCNLSCCCN